MIELKAGAIDNGRWRRFKKGRQKFWRKGKRQLIVTERRMESVREGSVGLKWKGREGKKVSD